MRKKFRDALDAAIKSSGETYASVARATGVSYEQLKKLKQGKSASTNVDDAVLIAHHFGMSLDEFIGDETQHKRREILDLYSRLSGPERDLLLAAARGFLAQAQAAGS